MDHLPVDVQHQHGLGLLRERPLGRHRTARPGRPRRARCTPAIQRHSWRRAGRALPRRCRRSPRSRSRPGVTEVSWLRASKHADDDVCEPPGDGRQRSRVGLGEGEVDSEVATARLDGRAAGAAGTDVPGAAAGSQKYSSVVEAASRGRSCCSQWTVSCSRRGVFRSGWSAISCRQSGNERGQFCPLYLAEWTMARDHCPGSPAARTAPVPPGVVRPRAGRALGVTVRSVRRDVDRLRALGYPCTPPRVPVAAISSDPRRALPPLLLDPEEAVAVGGLPQPGGRGLGRRGRRGRGAHPEQARPGAARPAPRPGRGGPAGDRDPRRCGPSPADPATLMTLARGCRDRHRVRFRYVARAGARTARRVEPYRLVATGRRWYLLAFDLDRDDWRRSGSTGYARWSATTWPSGRARRRTRRTTSPGRSAGRRTRSRRGCATTRRPWSASGSHRPRRVEPIDEEPACWWRAVSASTRSPSTSRHRLPGTVLSRRSCVEAMLALARRLRQLPAEVHHT